MTVFNIAMTTTMVIVMLAQLAISIALLTPSKKIAIKRWMNRKADFFLMFMLGLLGFSGVMKFVLTKDPGKWDYYMLACGTCLVAMSYAVMLASGIYRRMSEGFWRTQRIEEYLTYASEPSVEDADG